MPIISPPNPESRDIAKWFTEHERRINRVEAGLRTAQLGNSSINGSGGVDMFDANGAYRGRVGFQTDGTTNVTSQNPLPPPVPGAATVIPGNAHLLVKHNGETQDGTGNPADFSHLNIYTAAVGLPEIKTLRGTINPVPGEFPVTGLDYTNYLVTVTGVNLGGKESAHSQASSGTPTQVVSADLIAGIIQEIHLNSNIVSEANVKAGAITATKIADNSIETPHLVAGAVIASKIAANQINAGHIVANSITTEKINALAITGDKISANVINAGHIISGSVTAIKLEANMIIASRIIAGTSSGARVELHPTAGLQAYKADGVTRTFWINAANGEAYFAGEIETALSGSRIVINPNGNIPDEMRFYQGSVYGYINAEPAPGGTAAIVMRSQAVSLRLGSVGCYPAEAFIAYQTTAGVSLTAFSAINGSANVWSNGSISLDVRSTTGRVDFTHGDGANARLEYRSTAAVEPQLYAPGRNIALTWVGGSFGLYVGNDSGAGQPITASSFPTASSRITKKGERVIQLANVTSAREGLFEVRSKMWNYNHEWVEGESLPQLGKYKRDVVRRDDEGKVVVDPTTNLPIIDEEEFTEEPQVKTKPHIFPIAEDLQLSIPELVTTAPGIEGGLTVDVRSALGFLWHACYEQELELRAIRQELNTLKAAK